MYPFEAPGRSLRLHWTRRPASAGELYSGGDTKVICPNCRVPMNCVLGIPAGHDALARIGLATLDAAAVEFAFCWRCEAASDWLRYSLLPPWRVFWATRGEVHDDFPYPDYPREFARVAVDIGEALHACNEVGVSLLIAGEAVEGFEDRKCRECRGITRCQALVWDPAEEPSNFADNATVSMAFWVCSGCMTVTARHFI